MSVLPTIQFARFLSLLAGGFMVYANAQTTEKKSIDTSSEQSGIAVVRELNGDSGAKDLKWDLRLPRDTEISSALIADKKGARISGDFIARRQIIESGDSLTNIIFLIDTSDSRRREADIQASREIIGQLVRQAQPHHRFGLGILGENLQMICKVGTGVSEISEALGKKENFPNQSKTYIYRSIVGAIKELPEVGTGRSAIVVLSDGIAEDGGDVAYTIEDVLGHAKAKDVAIITIALERLPEFEKQALALAGLSNKTLAPFIHLKSPAYRIGTDVQGRLLKHLDSGGWVSVPKSAYIVGATVSIKALDRDFSAELIANNIVTEAVAPGENDIKNAKSPEGDGGAKEGAKIQPPADVIEEKEKVENGNNKAVAPKIFGMERSQAFRVLAAVIVLVLILIAVYAYLIIRKRKSADVEYSNEAVKPAAPLVPAQRRQTGAFLEDVQNPDTTYLILSSAVRVGRGVDNDIRLANDSVSKHHAELIRTSDDRFLVQDLSSGNGVFLNGNRIDSGEIRNGDLIEFGEVHLRFINKP